MAEVADRLGDNVATVQTTYARMIKNDGRRTRSAIDNAYEELRQSEQEPAADVR